MIDSDLFVHFGENCVILLQMFANNGALISFVQLVLDHSVFK